MKIQPTYTPNAPAAIGPYSQAIKANGMLFVSGQIPIDPLTGKIVQDDVERATEQVMKNLQAILKDSDTSWNQVVKTTIYLKNMADFPLVNQVYERFLGSSKPARATVAVSTLPKDALIEIDCIAVLESNP